MTLVFGVYPIIWALKYMFYDYQGYGEPLFIGLDNFTRLMRDTEFWQSVVNTLVYAGGKLLVTIPLSFVLAVILNRAFAGRQLLRAVYFLPTIVSASVMAIVFYVVFNSYNGTINQMLLASGIISAPIDWLGPKYALLTSIIIAIWGRSATTCCCSWPGCKISPKICTKPLRWMGRDRSAKCGALPCRCWDRCCK
ncbi:hypothetical protein HMSSN036_79520 [Paenibacillus macerans]|nr:hypothetical protein HMSSN036_79520 [Paenibacillus macerans]